MARRSTAQARPVKEPGPARPRAKQRAPVLPALETLVAAYPGPAARLDRDLHVLAANPSAQPLLIDLLAADSRLAHLVAQVAQGGAGRLEAIVLPTHPVPTTMEVAAIPVRDEIVLLGRDTSFNANLRDALTDSRRRYKDLVEISSDFVWETDTAGRFAFVSPGGALGWRADELNGRAASEFIIEDDDSSPFSGRRRLDNVSVWLRRADGQAACVSLSSVPLHGTDDSWLGARGVCRDVTEASLRDAALAEARTREQLFTYIVRTIRDEVEPAAMLSAAASAAARATSAAGTLIWRFDAENGFANVSDFGAAVPDDLAPEQGVLAKLTTSDAAADTETPPIEIETESGRLIGTVTRFRRKVNGAIALWRQPTAAGWSAADRGLLVELADQLGIAQAQIANIEALTALARTDPLTGLLNRRTFLEYVAPRVGRVHRSGQPGALVYLDLDNFKIVNDRFGHGRGDEALKCLAQSLHQASRVTDLVARLGGDEFVLWLDDTDRAGAAEKAKKLLDLDKVLAPFSGDAEKKLSVSIGVVMCEAGGAPHAEALIAAADAAMYRAKKAGKNGVVFAEAGSGGGP
jgi:diguanylate cyclase (GGDEF)-like protein/PAS domain S-box-containing protein